MAPNAAAWDVCNETSFVLRVAVVTTADGALVPKGWSRARPGQCLIFTSEDGQPRYVYAESSKAHQGGIREWTGTRTFCASEDDFVANTEVSCALQGLETRKYLSVDPSEQNTTFIEPLEYKAKAAAAGLQRLLTDNGYSIANIDGLSGRQTSRSLSSFLKDNGLKSTLSVAEKIDALETAAIERSGDVGVTVCNEASQRSWVALAYRLGAAWESRGWWPIEAGTCLRPHTASIKKVDAHIFALLETQMQSSEGDSELTAPPAGLTDDLILKSTAAVPAQFCIAESRFSATDRDNCSERGYSAASFRPLATDKDGVTLTYTESDFAPKKVGGLRQ